jgi:hypothetical protein
MQLSYTEQLMLEDLRCNECIILLRPNVKDPLHLLAVD